MTRQEENKKLEKIKNILLAGDLLDKGTDIKSTYEKYIDGAIIDLEKGQKLPEDDYTDELNVDGFEIKNIVKHPKYGKSIPANEDLAGIKRMPRYMSVYFVKTDNTIDKIILPVYGKGLWSTMYGFMALGKDLKTIEGFTFYEHGETPGLGGEVDNPNWKKIWRGKEAFDEDWQVKIEVIQSQISG
jgi:Na+-transporting NADH:ubiquinone oxidoreductase subunit C